MRLLRPALEGRHRGRRGARYVVVGTEGRQRFFVPGPLGRLVFGTLRDRHDTLAVCLLPDHLLWLLQDSAAARRSVRELKEMTTRLARHEGVEGRLWARGESHRRVREAAEQRRLAVRLDRLPVQSGLVGAAEEWPYRAVAWERLGDGAEPRTGPPP